MHGKDSLEEQRKSFRKCDECDTASDGKHDGLLHILVSVLHLEIDVERTNKDDNGSNGLHQVRYRSLVGTDFLSGLGKTCCTLASCHCIGCGNNECNGSHHTLLSKT